MFFMHGGAGYTRFIQNIGTALADGVFFPTALSLRETELHEDSYPELATWVMQS